MKRITFFVPSLSVAGGRERVVTNLANILSARDFEVSIVVFNGKNNPFYRLDKTVKIFSLPVLMEFGGSKMRRAIKWITYIFKLRRFIRKHKLQDLIGTDYIINICLWFATIGLNRKIIGCEHTVYNQMFIDKLWSKIRRFVYPKLAYIVALNNYDQDYYKQIGANAVLIPNALSFKPVQFSKLENKVLLTIGRMTIEKGYDMLLEAMRTVFDQHPEWKLRIIGDGELKERILNDIQKLSLGEHIEIIPVSNNIIEEYQNASICVLSSRFEGFPMVLIEAMACGVPCVSFDCDFGPREIIADNKDGLLVSPNDTGALATAVCSLITDEGKRKRFGSNASRNIQRFSPDIVINRWTDIFDNL